MLFVKMRRISCCSFWVIFMIERSDSWWPKHHFNIILEHKNPCLFYHCPSGYGKGCMCLTPNVYSIQPCAIKLWWGVVDTTLCEQVAPMFTRYNHVRSSCDEVWSIQLYVITFVSDWGRSVALALSCNCLHVLLPKHQEVTGTVVT
jgi:hypothetical protein